MVNWKKYRKYLIPAGVIGGLVTLGILSIPKAPPEKVEEAKEYAEEKEYDWSSIEDMVNTFLIKGYAVIDSVEKALEELEKKKEEIEATGIMAEITNWSVS